LSLVPEQAWPIGATGLFHCLLQATRHRFWFEERLSCND